jgi:outer membrane protein assembly factor BamB
MKVGSLPSGYRALAWNLEVGRVRGLLGLTPVVTAILIAVLFEVPTVGVPTAPGVSTPSSRLSTFESPTAGNASGNASASNGNATFTFSPSSPLPPISTLTNWPTYDQNQARTGDNAIENTLASPNVSYPGLVRFWSHQVKAGVFGSLAVVNGSVFAGDFNGNETALSAATGKQLWTVQLAKRSGNVSWTQCFSGKWNIKGITSTATVWNNTVFVTAGNNHLYALNASTGVNLTGWIAVDLSNHTLDPWRAYYGYGSTLVYHNNVYVGTASGCDNPVVQGQLLQINITTHSVVHVFNATPSTGDGGGIWSTPSLQRSTNASRSTIWVTTGNDNGSRTDNWSQAIVALNASNVCQPNLTGTCTSKGYYHVPSPGSWDYDYGAGVTVYTLANGTTMVAVMNKNGTAAAFYANAMKASGTKSWVWNATIASPSPYGLNVAPAAFNGSTLFFGGSHTKLQNHTVCPTGSVQAFDAGTGALKWQRCTPGFVRAGITYADGLVIDAADTLGNYSSTVEIRNSSTGNRVAAIGLLNQTVTGQPVVSDGRLFFGTGNWTTFCGNSTQHPCPPGYVYGYGIQLATFHSGMRPDGSGYSGLASYVKAWGNTTGGMPTFNFSWNSGAGHTSYVRNPRFGYVSSGTYFANLTATDAAGTTSSSTWAVTVHKYPCPPPSFGVCAITAVVPCFVSAVSCYGNQTPYRIFFAANLTQAQTGVTWSWNFGDGSAASELPDPGHTYTFHGTYTVTLTVTNSQHSQVTKTMQVTV